MQDLRVIGVENGALLVASVDGDRFRIPIDEVLQSKLRQTLPDPGAGRKISPREIQAHIRAGMSAQDVASITGVPIDYIQKYEGPVLAEREFVVETALGVAVHTALDTDGGAGNNFGDVIRQRLAGLGAVNERWASWKEEAAGWIVKLAFTADQIDHDARWSFDPKKLALSPLNSEAINLSQQGDSNGALIPRLRAVSGPADAADREQDSSRFDSGAFLVEDAEPSQQAGGRFPAYTQEVPEVDGYQKNQTANLLEALRRRRGEREAASYAEDEAPAESSSRDSGTGIRLVDVPLVEYLDSDQETQPQTKPQPKSPAPIEPTFQRGGSKPQDTAPQPQGPATQSATGQLRAARKGRAAMPSWDDIVFGARPDDDLA